MHKYKFLLSFLGCPCEKIFIQSTKYFADIPINTDRPLQDFPWRTGLPIIDTGIHRFGIFRCHSPERKFYYTGSVAAYAQFPKKNMFPFVAAKEVLIPPGGGVPAIIFHKSVVRPQVHGHRRAADRAVRHQLGGIFMSFCSDSIFLTMTSLS